jgi:hypothetical protein
MKIELAERIVGLIQGFLKMKPTLKETHNMVEKIAIVDSTRNRTKGYL